MKRTVTMLSLIVAAMAVFIVMQMRQLPARKSPAAAPAPAVTSAPPPEAAASQGTIGGEAAAASVRESRLPAPRRDLVEIQRRLTDGERGTYIREILLGRDDNIARWPDRQIDPLRVWVQPTSALRDFEPEYARRAMAAFERWTHAGVPVSFVFVHDSASSDIPLTWVDHFDMPISGRTKWTRDQHWWITASSVEIALHHQSGTPLGSDAIYAITLHEVGHVLGLDHTQDAGNIMAARVRVHDLSTSDEQTAQLVYSLPPGSVSRP